MKLNMEENELNYDCPHCLYYEVKKNGCGFGFHRNENKKEEDESDRHTVREEHGNSGD